LIEELIDGTDVPSRVLLECVVELQVHSAIEGPAGHGRIKDHLIGVADDHSMEVGTFLLQDVEVVVQGRGGG
jgi:hypothetical protein